MFDSLAISGLSFAQFGKGELFDPTSQSLFLSLRKRCPYSELFWFTFSRIRTEYGEVSLRI